MQAPILFELLPGKPMKTGLPTDRATGAETEEVIDFHEVLAELTELETAESGEIEPSLLVEGAEGEQTETDAESVLADSETKAAEAPVDADTDMQAALVPPAPVPVSLPTDGPRDGRSDANQATVAKVSRPISPTPVADGIDSIRSDGAKPENLRSAKEGNTQPDTPAHVRDSLRAEPQRPTRSSQTAATIASSLGNADLDRAAPLQATAVPAPKPSDQPQAQQLRDLSQIQTPARAVAAEVVAVDTNARTERAALPPLAAAVVPASDKQQGAPLAPTPATSRIEGQAPLASAPPAVTDEISVRTSETTPQPRPPSVELPSQQTPSAVAQMPMNAAAPTFVSAEAAPLGDVATSPFREVSAVYTPAAKVDLTAPSPVQAAQISSQMTEAAKNQSPGRVELTLHPEELGKVRMGISAQEHGMVIVISADKLETLDLMRRHIDLFAKDMEQLGFSDVEFSFDANQGGASWDRENSASGTTNDSSFIGTGEETEDSPHQPPSALPPGGLDLRL